MYSLWILISVEVKNHNDDDEIKLSVEGDSEKRVLMLLN